MAISFTRSSVCKSMKCLATVVIIAFFSQIVLALYYFPSDHNVMANINKMLSSKIKLGDSSAGKLKAGLEDDEEFSKNVRAGKPGLVLRIEELEFSPECHIHSKEAISAIHRAKTQECKKLIADITCEIQDSTFYPEKLPNSCPNQKHTYGKYRGCYQDEKKFRILSSFYGNYPNTNSPESCMNICIQGGFPYAGVQYVSECFCGDTLPESHLLIKESKCDMKCPGDRPKTCGGYFTMNIYETGLKKFEPQIPKVPTDNNAVTPKVRIVFLLTLNGRALRQVYRLINALYSTEHYFFIHVDERQDYLHRKLLALEEQFNNIKLARRRFATIWGGASLLQMLLASMSEFSVLGWQWDFVINLSESDFPIKSLTSLENFLALNKGLNFVKSHGREVQRFIKKQGLDRTFVECDTHMWRIGERKLPKGIVVDGGSDWIALSSDFVTYVTGPSDPLLAGLLTVFQHTLLPAESFFHTALKNSKFCSTYVDNNLHVTNWKRKLGCKCQYKHVVDWCGCSPNDFTVEDWPRIQNTQDRQLYFARKFEPIINQEVITRVEKWIGFEDHHLIGNLASYWQSIYDWRDRGASSEDLLRTHAASVLRHNAKLLLEGDCAVTPGETLQIHSYSEADVYKGNLILHTALVNQTFKIVLETWYKPQNKVVLDANIKNSDHVKVFKVSSDYDQKESTFRNLANVLGPFSEPVLLYHLSAPIDKPKENLTTIWVDPTGAIADINHVYIDEHNLTSFVKPSLKMPIVPGVWSVGLVSEARILIAQTKFLITPLQYYGGKEMSEKDVETVHSGSQRSYNQFSNFKLIHFIPSQEESLLLNKLSKANNKKLDEELSDWIDSLTYMFYNLLGTCVSGLKEPLICGQHLLQECKGTKWSSKVPDPKGQIGKINKKTGRLDRVENENAFI